MSVIRSHVCHNATDMAVIEGEVQGYPVADVFFYQVIEDDMQLVRGTQLHTLLIISLSLSLQVVNSRVTIYHPTDDSTSFRITISDLLTSDQGTYVVRANNSVGTSEHVQVLLTVKGTFFLLYLLL